MAIHYIWNTYHFVEFIDMVFAMSMYSGITVPPNMSVEQYIELVKEKLPYRTIQVEEEEEE